MSLITSRQIIFAFLIGLPLGGFLAVVAVGLVFDSAPRMIDFLGCGIAVSLLLCGVAMIHSAWRRPRIIDKHHSGNSGNVD